MGPIGGTGGGGGGLGNAVFTATANTQPLVQGMQQAQAATQQAANAIQGTLTGASHGAARSFLQLSYAIDDVQYGFRAIVNNIPQILMFLGPGIAGAAGIAAVAVSQLINHWEGLSAIWGGEVAKLPVLKTGLEGLEESLKKITAAVRELTEAEEARRTATSTSLMDIATGAGITDKDKLRKLQELEKEGKERLKAEKDVAGTEQSDEMKDTGKRVRAAIGKMAGGSDELMDVLTNQGMTPDEAKKAISGALGGNTGYLDDILARTKGQKGAGYEDLANASPERQRQIAQKNLDLAGDRQGRKNEEKAADKNKELVDKLNQQGQENQRRAEAERKQDRIQDLQDQRDKIMDEKRAINDAAFASRHETRPAQILDSAKAVVDMYQKSAAGNKAEDIAKRTHALQEAANKKLDVIATELKKEQRVRPA
jgi:hypothetical protein